MAITQLEKLPVTRAQANVCITDFLKLTITIGRALYGTLEAKGVYFQIQNCGGKLAFFFFFFQIILILSDLAN